MLQVTGGSQKRFVSHRTKQPPALVSPAWQCPCPIRVQPHLRCRIEIASQPERRVGGNSPPPSQNVRNTALRHAQFTGNCLGRHAQFLQFFTQYHAGLYRPHTTLDHVFILVSDSRLSLCICYTSSGLAPQHMSISNLTTSQILHLNAMLICGDKIVIWVPMVNDETLIIIRSSVIAALREDADPARARQ